MSSPSEPGRDALMRGSGTDVVSAHCGRTAMRDDHGVVLVDGNYRIDVTPVKSIFDHCEHCLRCFTNANSTATHRDLTPS